MGVRVYFFIKMKLIDSKVEYLPQGEGLNGIYKQIEIAGRTAYQSLDKITDDSAKGFVDRMINSKHFAALEHGTVYLKVPYTDWIRDEHEWTYMFPEGLPWASVDSDGKYCYITTNYRHIENKVGATTMLKYLCEPTEFHEKRYTLRFTCDRGVSHQTVRERLMSFLQESQRFCAYIKEKFGGSVTFIQPCWIKSSDQKEFEEDLKIVEQLYFKWFNKGYKAEEARYFLINGTKTEIVVTALASDWKHMVDLRYFEKTGKVSPDMRDLMQKVHAVMQEAGIWHDIMKYPSKFK